MAFCQVDKDHLIVYYAMRAIQSRGFPPNLFSCIIGVWPSGKAVDDMYYTMCREHPKSAKPASKVHAQQSPPHGTAFLTAIRESTNFDEAGLLADDILMPSH